MEQCWDAIPSKRPNSYTLGDEIDKINISYYQNENEQHNTNNVRLNTNYINSGSINSLARRLSRIHIFEGLPEPRNATKGKLLKFSFIIFKN